ncbi:MAG: hypothetical protein Q7R54_00245 [bacterium]|nr:hypothetical protein [bacterium]
MDKDGVMWYVPEGRRRPVYQAQRAAELVFAMWLRQNIAYIAYLATLPLILLVRGWALMVMWNWFLADPNPYSLHLREYRLTIFSAIGIVIIVKMLFARGLEIRSIPDTPREITLNIGFQLFLPVFCLIVSWLVLQFNPFGFNPLNF